MHCGDPMEMYVTIHPLYPPSTAGVLLCWHAM